MKMLIGLIVILFIVAIYFLPTVVAYKRKYKNRMSVFIIDLFLGWTLVGWVIALALAFINDVDENNVQSDKVVKYISALGIFLFIVFAIFAFIGYEKHSRNNKNINLFVDNNISTQASNNHENKNSATILFQPHKLVNMKSDEIKKILSNLSPLDIETAYADGGNINAKDKLGQTVLMYASQYCDNSEIIEILIKHGAKIDIRDTTIWGKNALMYASEYNSNPDIIETLIIHGADVNARDVHSKKTVLMYASEKNNNPEIIETLIVKGAKVNDVDYFHDNALIYASRYNNNPEVIETLITNKAEDIKSAFWNACEYSENPKVFDVFLKHGMNINDKKAENFNLLMCASAKNHNIEIIKYLIDKGLDVNAKTKDGKTALMYASEHNSNQEIIKMLIARGANVNEKDKNGFNALMFAYSKTFGPDKNIVELLLQSGIDINDKDAEGKTVLMQACETSRHIGFINNLLEHGADVGTKDKKGNTVYDYARKNKNILYSKIKTVLDKYNDKDSNE